MASLSWAYDKSGSFYSSSTKVGVILAWNVA
jgi:hypothetical protein